MGTFLMSLNLLNLLNDFDIRILFENNFKVVASILIILKVRILTIKKVS